MTRNLDKQEKRILSILKKMGVRLTSKFRRADRNSATHWWVTIHHGNKALTTEYSMGSAHKGSPNLVNVMSCLALDAGSVIYGQTLDDFTSDLGYDEKEGRVIYGKCKSIARKLRDIGLKPHKLVKLFQDY